MGSGVAGGVVCHPSSDKEPPDTEVSGSVNEVPAGLRRGEKSAECLVLMVKADKGGKV